MTPPKEESKIQIESEISIDQNQTQQNIITKTKKEVIGSSNRVAILTPSLQGSINLKGAILDDLILLKYKETLDENSEYINLFSPEQTSNPYYFELGWKTLVNDSSNVFKSALRAAISASIKLIAPSFFKGSI